MTVLNKRQIKVNDSIIITYYTGSKKIMKVTRVEEKSWYEGNKRRSYGSIEHWFKNPVDIINCEIKKS